MPSAVPKSVYNEAFLSMGLIVIVVEFQKRGLPYCHMLLKVDVPTRDFITITADAGGPP